MQTVVITRHPALVEVLRELGLADAQTPILAHATAEQVRGRRVIGVLPLHLAAEAAEVVEVPLHIPESLRGRELTADEIRRYAGEPMCYRVRGERLLPADPPGTTRRVWLDVCWRCHERRLDWGTVFAPQRRGCIICGRWPAGLRYYAEIMVLPPGTWRIQEILRAPDDTRRETC